MEPIRISERTSYRIISKGTICVNYPEIKSRKIGERFELICEHSKRILEVEILDTGLPDWPNVLTVSLRRMRISTRKK